MDPTWLDLFAEAARTATDRDAPGRLHRRPDRARADRATPRRHRRAGRPGLDHAPSPGSRTGPLDAIAGRWIDRLEEEFGAAAREEKPWIRDLAGQVVALLPGRRPRARRRVRVGAAMTATRPRGVVRRQPGALGGLDRGPRRPATSTTSPASGRAASGCATTRSRPLGDVPGQSLLHLQCHFGIDTLSWARLGATVTGADFSPAADPARPRAGGRPRLPRRALRRVEPVRPAGRPRRRLRRRLHVARRPRLAARHPRLGAGRRPLRQARRAVLHHRGPSGRPGLRERGRRPGELRLAYPYWEHREPLVFDVQGSYADPTADVGDAEGARLGPRPRRDRHRAHRRRPASSSGCESARARLGGRLPRRDRARAAAASCCRRGAPGELPLMFSLLATKPVADLTYTGYAQSSYPASGATTGPSGRTIGRTRPWPSMRATSANAARPRRLRVKEIEAAWLGSLTPAVGQGLHRRRRPPPAPARRRSPRPSRWRPAPPRARRARAASRARRKEERKRSRPFKD